MAQAEGRAFYVQSWMTRATIGLAVVQLLGAGLLAAFASSLGIGPLLPTLFVAGAALTAYQAYWTQRTPLAVIKQDGLRLRPALLAPERELAYDSLRGFATIEPGWLVLLERNGEETRMPLTAFSDADSVALLEELALHLTRVRYVED